MAKNRLFGVITGLFCSYFGIAQAHYTLGVGVRGGNPLGVTGKYFLSETSAVEGILAYQLVRGYGIVGLYEYHGAIGREPLNWFAGAGGSLMAFSIDKKVTIGVDAILGIEYTLVRRPINFSIDWKPGYSSYYRWKLDQVAVSVRYTPF
jgi:hypothetical protein